MRPVWKGSVAFGLVNIPVELYSATDDHDIRFHQVHGVDGRRIRYRRFCEADGAEVSYEDIAKGYRREDGELIILEGGDFDKLPVETGREIEVVHFVPTGQVDPLLFDRSYFL